MKLSVYIEFEAEFPSTDLVRIYNADFLASLFRSELEMTGHAVVSDDLWNDFGWYLVVMCNEIKFTIQFAKYSDKDNWELIIEPTNYPNILQRGFGARPVEYLPSLQELTNTIFNTLRSSPYVDRLEICLSNNTKITVDSPDELNW